MSVVESLFDYSNIEMIVKGINNSRGEKEEKCRETKKREESSCDASQGLSGKMRASKLALSSSGSKGRGESETKQRAALRMEWAVRMERLSIKPVDKKASTSREDGRRDRRDKQ